MPQEIAAESNAGPEVAEQLGLLPEEFERIVEILGRNPNFTELSIFSVMWSEHCSYKNSIRWLKTLPREGEKLLAEAGEENAGLVDLGNGKACAFKIESHNHPSAIEPYQGAATGVGGIHRDIFTMGARPIAALNSLRFGDLKHPRTKKLLRGVVRGIGDYGNSFGVPTVGGEVYFDLVYQTNPLVNAMSVGIVDTDGVVSAISEGVGNPVFIVGSSTGKDGIHGATFASEDISEDSEDKLPAVQVGDPFQEKLLLEASLEVIATGAVVGMQDMGAAGITCSTSEMSAKGGCGMRVWLEKVPTRQPNMKPFEILLSESQERMLVVVHKGREKEVEEVFEKWDLNCVQIGEVTEGGRIEFLMNGELVADVPADDLVLGGGAPVYEREYREPEYFSRLQTFDSSSVPIPEDLRKVAESLAAHLNIASRRWVSQQYDSMVGIVNTGVNDPSDAAVIRIPDSDTKLGVTVDCNARYIWADPYKGAMIAVSEAARNLVCSGARPSAITNCLNFGNPYKPEVYWQFVQVIKGMGEACRRFDTPVTGGNVSFYNQSTDGGAVYPTPTIGMIGVIDPGNPVCTLGFKQEGDAIYLLGQSHADLGSSVYLEAIHGIAESPAPRFDLEEEHQLQSVLLELIHKGLLQSAHDCSEGGLFIALMESALPAGTGFSITTDASIRSDAFLFGESQSRVVVSVHPSDIAKFESALTQSGLPHRFLGNVIPDQLAIDGTYFGQVEDYRKLHEQALEKTLHAG